MWHAVPQADEPEEQQPPAPSAGGAKSGAPWQLKRANNVGATKLYSEPSNQGDIASRLYFAGRVEPYTRYPGVGHPAWDARPELLSSCRLLQHPATNNNVSQAIRPRMQGKDCR